jgi:heme exporter protein A
MARMDDVSRPPAEQAPRLTRPAPTAAPAPDTPALQLTDVARAYGERIALQGVTLTLNRGDTLVVLGPNGAGKTTLLRVLAMLVRATHGTVTILGHELPTDAWAVRGRVGLLGHEPLLYRELTARENLVYHARLHAIDDARIDELLQAVGMHKRADEPVRLLSRGMVQRVAICRAVLAKPPLLLLDEPFANLDPSATAQVEPLIGATAQATRVICSHDPAGSLPSADLVLGLRDGRVTLLAPPGEVDADEIAHLYR